MIVNAAVAADHAFFERARARLSLDLPETMRRDLYDSPPPESATSATARRLKPAAVLIPVVDRPNPTVLLTQRTTSLSSHAGQIAFPGGKVDEIDTSPLATALREADEEIGLPAADVDPIGYLDLYATGTGYRIVPVVARVKPTYHLQLNPHEVEDAFEVPLAFLMDRANHQLHVREWNGQPRRFYAMPWRDRYIWGVTAAILRGLADRIYGS